MICPKCQSENVQTHLVQTEGKSRHSSVGLGGKHEQHGPFRYCYRDDGNVQPRVEEVNGRIQAEIQALQDGCLPSMRP